MEYVGSNGSLLFFANDRNGAIIDPALNIVVETGRVDALSATQSWSISEHDITVSDSAIELAEASLSMLDIGVIASSGRKYTIPAGVQSEAKKALEWRKKNKRGGTPVGLNTARTLAKGGQIGLEKVRHIAKYFPRHEVDKKGKGWSPKEDGFPSNGRIAWALWGGDAGQRWASAIVESENKKAITADGYALPSYEAIPDAKAYDEQYVGDINDFARDDMGAPDFIARIRLDGSGIDRLYKIDDDGNVYVWDNGSWDDLGSMHGDIWARDVDLDGEDDYVEKTHVTIDPQSAITIAALLQEDPFRNVSIEDLDDGEEEARMALDALPEIDCNIVNLAMTAAGDTTKANAEYTPEERSEAATKQVRDATGKFATVGARVAVDKDAGKKGNITRVDKASGTVSVKLDSGETVQVSGKQVGPSTLVYPPAIPVTPDSFQPLDLSGMLGEPRTPMGRSIAQLPGTLPALTPADLHNLLADWPSWVSAQRAQFSPRPEAQGVEVQPRNSTSKGAFGEALEDEVGKELTLDAYKHPLLKDWLKKKNQSTDVGNSIWYRPITAAAGDKDVAVEITPATTDVQPIYMAIVSPDDPRAVMQLSVLVPENTKSNKPMIWTRQAGTWVKDVQTLADLNSATPPPVVPLDATVLNDVLNQVDVAQETRESAKEEAPVTASGRISTDQALMVLFGEKFEAIVAAGGADRNRGGAEELRKYWTVGKGGLKIRWGTGGDWTRCVRNLKKYMGPRAKGYCALRHKEMNGVWPGDKRNQEFSYQEANGRVFSSDVIRDSEEINTLMVLNARRQDSIDKVNFIAGRTNATADFGYSPETDLLPEDIALVAAVDGETCPPATQDIELNLANRQNAIDNVGYGPLNPNEPNDEFWQEKGDKWDVSAEDAKKSVCGNCVFFIRTPQMLDCISTGIEQGGSSADDADASIDQAELGYCEALDFKCAASRTCNAWAVGGPITATAGSKPAPKKDQIKGSDKNKAGSAGTGKGVTFTDKIEKALSKKVSDHNAKAKDGRKTSLRTLKAVYRRGAGAFSTSHRPDQNRNSWAMARVNAFLHLLKSGSPKNSKYTTDNDLLPSGHPKAKAVTAGGYDMQKTEYSTDGARFYIPLVIPEETESGDGRVFTKGAIELRDLPLPLLWQFKTGDGHDGSVVVGRIDHMERVDGGIGNAHGVFDTGAYGREAERLVRNGFIRGVSADMDRFEAEEEDDKEAAAKDGGKKQIKKSRISINKARVMAVTIVPKPAFQECRIFLPEDGEVIFQEEQTMQDGIYTDEVDPSDAEAIMACGLVASAIPVAPPKEWFGDPKLTKATPLTVDDEGRVFGHIASWSTNHIGLSNGVKPPRSKSKYGYFHTGVVRTAEGADIPVGQLTLAGGHASLHASASEAVKHYDDTASAVADVHAGEDRYGIWVAGALRPSVQPEQIRTLRASAPSGDWRPIGGSLELVAVCQVNVPGFPIARAMIASGQVTALVAAGAATLARMKSDPMADLNSRIAKLEKLTLSDKKAELSARFRGGEFGYGYEAGSDSYAQSNAGIASVLKDLLSDLVAFGHRAQGHHWNVEGVNFPEYHKLFGKLYEDVHGSVDTLAESIRTMGHSAPNSIEEFAMDTDIENRPLQDAMCQTLAYDLSIGNGIIIQKLKDAFKVAENCNEQGIADFIAGRIEAHQKWQWQLMVSIAPSGSHDGEYQEEEYDEDGAYKVYKMVFSNLEEQGLVELPLVASADVTDLVEEFDAIMQFADFSKEQREALAKKGQALPDGSYPIRNESDLKNAIKAYGRAKESERAEVKKHIAKRARALGKMFLIPENWNVASSLTASAKLDQMRDKLSTFDNLGAVSETDPKKAFSGIATSQLPLELSIEEFEAFASAVDAELEKLVKKTVKDAPVSEQEIDRAIADADQPVPEPQTAPQTDETPTDVVAEGEEIVAPSGEINIDVEQAPMTEDGKYVPGKTQPRDIQGRFRLVLARLKNDLGTSGNQDVIDKITEAENLIGNTGDYAGAVKAASDLISKIDRLDSGALNAKSVENVRATTTDLGRTIANLPLPFENQATKVRFSDLPAALKSLAEDLINRVEEKIGKKEADVATKELRGFMSGNDVYNQGEVSSQFNRLLRLLT